MYSAQIYSVNVFRTQTDKIRRQNVAQIAQIQMYSAQMYSANVFRTNIFCKCIPHKDWQDKTPKLPKSRPWLLGQAAFQFCPICSFFADSSFLPDFSFREFPIFAGFLFASDFWPGFGKFGAKVWGGGEVRIAKAWKFQKHFRNLWHQCICSALQSRTQCNVEMKKKSHR